MLIDKNKFFNLQKSMDFIPYEQAGGWHDFRAASKKANCLYFVDNETEPNICAWGMIRKIPLFGKILHINGESYKHGVPRSAVRQFYEEIAFYSDKHFIFVLVSSSGLYDINYEIAIRQAGFVRPMVLTTCPLSIVVDLDCIERRRIWKRKIKEAYENNLKFQYIENPNFEQIQLVVQMYSELVKLKHLEYEININSLILLFNDRNFKLFVVYSSEKIPVCARIVYIIDDYSCDVIAANSFQSRKEKGSTYFIIDSLLAWLKDIGVRKFDFGRIGPGKRSTNSVYEFKAALGSPEVAYNGEWVYSKHKFLERFLYFLLSFKANRY